MGSAVNTYSGTRLMPAYPRSSYKRESVKLDVNLTLDAGTVMAEKVGNDEVQRITVDATGGTFTVAFNGSGASAPIAFDAAASAVQSALEALSTIGHGNVAVSGSAGGPWDLTFQNQLGERNVPQVTCDSTGLTGGTHTATPSTVTPGATITGGVFAAYDPLATNGLQNPVGFLEYPCTTDASGNIIFGGAASFDVTEPSAPVYFGGSFKTSELVGFDDNAVSALGGHLLSGTSSDGVFTF